MLIVERWHFHVTQTHGPSVLGKERMNTPAWLASAAHIALLIAAPVVLIVSPLYLFVTPGFVRHEYGRADFPHANRFSDEERLLISDTILHYLRGRESLEAMASTRTESGETALRDSEVQHLVDVRVVMSAFFRAHSIALILGLACVLLLWHSPRRSSLPLYLRQSIWVSAGLMAAIILISFIDFDLFFTRFHQVFFTAGSWLFYEDDTLIQLYPLAFWGDTVWKIATTILIEAGLMYLLAFTLERGPTKGA